MVGEASGRSGSTNAGLRSECSNGCELEGVEPGDDVEAVLTQGKTLSRADAQIGARDEAAGDRDHPHDEEDRPVGRDAKGLRTELDAVRLDHSLGHVAPPLFECLLNHRVPLELVHQRLKRS